MSEQDMRAAISQLEQTVREINAVVLKESDLPYFFISIAKRLSS